MFQVELHAERTDRRTQCSDIYTLCREPPSAGLRDRPLLSTEEGEGEITKDLVRYGNCGASVYPRTVLATSDVEQTHTLMKQLGLIRKSWGVSHSRSSTPEANPPLPRARRPIPDPNVSPPPNRLAKAPTFPGIIEDDEGNASSPEDPEPDAEIDSSPPLPRKRKSKPRTSSSSSSRLPIPSLKAASPPTVETVHIEFEEALGKSGKRRPTRRQSGLLTSVSITAVTTDGLDPPHSPVPDSPPRDAFDEEDVAGEPDEDEVEAILQAVTKRREKREKDSERGRELDTDSAVESVRPRERRKPRAVEDPADAPEGSKYKFKDVTNAQASRAALPALDTTSSTYQSLRVHPHVLIHDPDHDRRRTPDVDMPSSATSTSVASSSTRNFLSTPATTPAPSSKPMSHLPTPRSSSPLAEPPQTDSESAAGGRERRVRKSVNYAEPKLNTYVLII